MLLLVFAIFCNYCNSLPTLCKIFSKCKVHALISEFPDLPFLCWQSSWPMCSQPTCCWCQPSPMLSSQLLFCSCVEYQSSSWWDESSWGSCPSWQHHCMVHLPRPAKTIKLNRNWKPEHLICFSDGGEESFMCMLLQLFYTPDFNLRQISSLLVLTLLWVMQSTMTTSFPWSGPKAT